MYIDKKKKKKEENSAFGKERNCGQKIEKNSMLC